MKPHGQSRTFNQYAKQIQAVSRAIVAAQQPIRILDAIKWSGEVDQFLLKNKFKELPHWGADDYRRVKLGFDPIKRIDKFQEIINRINRIFSKRSPLARLLLTTCHEYQDACRLLLNRGTWRFGKISQQLYGSAHDEFHNKKILVKDLGHTLMKILTTFDISYIEGKQDRKNLSAARVVKLLNQRLDRYFHSHDIIAEVSDSLVADAAAGSDRVKLRSDAKFSIRDVGILEVHEGWVHIGTTLNGKAQKYAKWLAKGPPRVTATQEGLAVLMEVLTFRSTPRRMRRINDRLFGIYMVENGADLIDLARFYQKLGYSAEETLYNVKRIFRGSVFTGGYPFTKDISYAKGFVENHHFIREHIAKGQLEMIPFLFAGKLHISDVPLIYELYQEGLVQYPHYLPSLFSDLNGIAVWMSFAQFLNRT